MLHITECEARGTGSSHACQTVSRADAESALRRLGAFTHSFNKRPCHLSTRVTGPTSAEQRGQDPLRGRHPRSREAVRPGNILMTTEGHSRLPHRAGGPKATVPSLWSWGRSSGRQLPGAGGCMELPASWLPASPPHPTPAPPLPKAEQGKQGLASQDRRQNSEQEPSFPAHWLVGCIPPATGPVSSDIIRVSIPSN